MFSQPWSIAKSGAPEMSFSDCLNRAVEDGLADKGRGDRAQALWQELADRYAAQGRPRGVAEALASEDVKRVFRKEAGDKRHSFTAQVDVMRRIEKRVEDSPNLARLATDRFEYLDGAANKGLTLAGQRNALRRMFHQRLALLVRQHSRSMIGNAKDPAGLMNMTRELFGESTGDAQAQAIAKSVREVFRDMRRMFNEAGGVIGELDDWGLPHVHNRLAVSKAGFDRWSKEIEGSIAWHRIEDHKTGMPFAAEGQMPAAEVRQAFLREVYDNIVFGRDSQEAIYGKVQGKSLVGQMAQSRVLHFKSADDWSAYNKEFGSGNAYAAMIAHAHSMADRIILLREYGPSASLAMDYERQLMVKKARDTGDVDLVGRIEKNAKHASFMLRAYSGGTPPSSLKQAQIASFFSTTRMIVGAAHLDRAVVAALSDTNTARMAAKAMKMGAGTHLKNFFDTLRGANKEDLLRMGWVNDTAVDPGLVLARFQSEFPPSEIAERISSFVMRAQGLTYWTDSGKAAWQWTTSGEFASWGQAPLSSIDAPLAEKLRAKNVTDDEWKAFTDPDSLFVAGNGATFADPLYWRSNTDMDPAKADGLFLKVQSVIEEQSEIAVPTQSLYFRAAAERDFEPGTATYELSKSVTAYKSFVSSFTINQASRIASMNTWQQRAMYGLDLAAGATVLGATSLLIADLINGRDPSDMSNPEFWGKAMLKGGGFGVIGDIIAAGESSWGGGFQSFVAGPGIQLVGDVWNLSVGNAVEVMGGKETKAGREFVRFLNRYSPATDLPYVGIAIDRVLWNNLQKLLDPEADEAFSMAAKRTIKDNGSAGWWLPGETLPARAPDPLKALGID